MQVKFYFILLLAAFVPSVVYAQIPVTDGANIAQSIVNSSQELVQSTTTASNMVKNFQETVKIYEQGKKYYDALRKVNNLVRDALKVQKTILMLGEISDIYVNSYQKMLRDKNYTALELAAIGRGYAQLLQESTDILLELKNVVNATSMSMTDKERFDLIERSYQSILRYKNLVSYYTNKNISISYLRSAKTGEIGRFLRLYGEAERYW
ncbi:DUF4141 domain-containing protein [Culturomica massiliensis]|uniref:DUF4141 domain-containing protein n=1 Tax=Culturomica massiliensis TaxID=1841857 RepID=UPI002664F118|nr:DUF4141 domain-containing protein [Culturomica massiliensis]